MASFEALQLAGKLTGEWHMGPPNKMPANLWTYMKLTEEEYHVYLQNMNLLPDDFVERHSLDALSFTVDQNNDFEITYKVTKKNDSNHLGVIRVYVGAQWIFDAHDFISLSEMIEIAEFMSNLPDLNVEEPQF